MKGQLWIVAAPSGGGKTSLIREACQRMIGIVESVSFTTRERREQEIEGFHYHFVAKEEFLKRLEQGDFLEHAEVFNNLYGTSASYVDGLLEQGLDVILNIDWQGAEQIKAKRPDALSIFLLPPSIAVLRQRLINRNQDNIEVIERRMSLAKEQISHYKDFDFVIINDDFEKAAAQMQSIIKAERLKKPRQERELLDLVAKLNAE